MGDCDSGGGMMSFDFDKLRECKRIRHKIKRLIANASLGYPPQNYEMIFPIDYNYRTYWQRPEAQGRNNEK